jgi:hypothetical protein
MLEQLLLEAILLAAAPAAVLQAPQDLKERLETPEELDQLDQRELLAPQDLKERQEMLELRDQRDQ